MKLENNQRTVKKIPLVSSFISVISLCNYSKCKWNEFSNQKLQNVWIDLKKIKTQLYAIYETYFSFKDTYRVKMKGWEKTFYASGNQKKVEVTILLSDKVDFKPKMLV